MTGRYGTWKRWQGSGDGDVGLKEDGSPPSCSGCEQGHMAEFTLKTRAQVPRGPSGAPSGRPPSQGLPVRLCVDRISTAKC